jgi:hypothetical protein
LLYPEDLLNILWSVLKIVKSFSRGLVRRRPGGFGGLEPPIPIIERIIFQGSFRFGERIGAPARKSGTMVPAVFVFSIMRQKVLRDAAPN